MPDSTAMFKNLEELTVPSMEKITNLIKLMQDDSEAVIDKKVKESLKSLAKEITGFIKK